MQHFHQSVASMILALSATLSHATAIERTVTVDLGTLGLPAAKIPEEEVYLVTPVDPFSVNTGDTLVLRYEFESGRLRVVDSGAPSYEYFGWNLFTDNFGKTGYTWKTSFHFEGVGGGLLQNDFVYSFGGPLGAFLPNVNLTDTSFAFGGFSLTFFDIENHRDDGQPFTSDVVSFNAFFSPEDGLFLENPVREVPEPRSAFLLLLGLLILGGLTIRSKKAC